VHTCAQATTTFLRALICQLRARRHGSTLALAQRSWEVPPAQAEDSKPPQPLHTGDLQQSAQRLVGPAAHAAQRPVSRGAAQSACAAAEADAPAPAALTPTHGPTESLRVDCGSVWRVWIRVTQRNAPTATRERATRAARTRGRTGTRAGRTPLAHGRSSHGRGTVRYDESGLPATTGTVCFPCSKTSGRGEPPDFF
jgi:hypothetical protein